MAHTFVASVKDGIRVKEFTFTSLSADAGIGNVATIDFTTSLMTDLPADPDEWNIILVDGTNGHSCKPVITAADAHGVTVGILQPTNAGETFTSRVTVRLTRGIGQ